jgi:TPR repeat protein
MRLFVPILIAAMGLALPAQADTAEGLRAVARRDFAAAFAAFEPAARQGDVAAQVNLGNLYMKGLGVAQNYGEALRWYRRAADQGAVMAYDKLGILHFYGLGTPKDPVEAARWFELAARQGDIHAQAILASLYASGEGVARDRAQAYYWYAMAEDRGDAEAAKGRASLEEEMTPGEKDEALRLLGEARKRQGEAEEKALEAALAGKIAPDAKPGAVREEKAARVAGKNRQDGQSARKAKPKRARSTAEKAKPSAKKSKR